MISKFSGSYTKRGKEYSYTNISSSFYLLFLSIRLMKRNDNSLPYNRETTPLLYALLRFYLKINLP